MLNSGRISQSNALILLFKFRAKAAADRGYSNSVYAAIAKNLSENGGSDSVQEPAKEGDPHLPLG
jgi:hypothetical protein